MYAPSIPSLTDFLYFFLCITNYKYKHKNKCALALIMLALTVYLSFQCVVMYARLFYFYATIVSRK